jgi:hypothetical protein
LHFRHSKLTVTSFNSFYIFSGAGIYFDFFAFVDKQWYLNYGTTCNGCGFAASLCGITAKAGIGVCYFRFYVIRWLGIKDPVVFNINNRVQIIPSVTNSDFSTLDCSRGICS